MRRMKPCTGRPYAEANHKSGGTACSVRDFLCICLDAIACDELRYGLLLAFVRTLIGSQGERNRTLLPKGASSALNSGVMP